VFGASGAGTSSLGRALAQRVGAAFFDTDDFFWELTNPPFTQPRPVEVRQQSLHDALLSSTSGWVLSGSLCGWGDVVIPMFDAAVFVYTPAAERLARLRVRERARYGPRIEPGGDLFEHHRAFLEWAGRYDEGGLDVRSLRRHEVWMTTLPCPIVRVDGMRSASELVEIILADPSRLRGVLSR
jgi:adenylate kinase family enzyme